MTGPLGYYPGDILPIIFKELSTTDQYALCLVNSRFRVLAGPFLYSEVEWEWGGDKESIPPIFLLLRILSARPDLGHHVQSFAIREFGTSRSISNLPSLSIDERRRLTSLVNNFEILSWHNW